MKIKMNFRVAIPFISILAVSSAFASETYVCRHSDSQRVISVEYEVEGSAVPCKVTYEKSTGSQVLWTAATEEGYCEAKASEFVAKQRDWGWECDNNADAAADVAEAPIEEEVVEEQAMAESPEAASEELASEDSAKLEEMIEDAAADIPAENTEEIEAE